jgi:hypothetical protein
MIPNQKTSEAFWLLTSGCQLSAINYQHCLRRLQRDEMRSIFADVDLGGDFEDPQSDTFG